MQVDLNGKKLKCAVLKMLRHSDVRVFTCAISQQNELWFTKISLLFLQLALGRTNNKKNVTQDFTFE